MAQTRISIDVLTAREREILEFIGQGRTSKEIATALDISLGTVGNHRKSLCKKLNVHSTAELASCGALQLIEARSAPAG